MSQPDGQVSKLSGIQKLIVITTFLGTLGLSIANRPAVAFGIVGLGTLLLLLFGTDIARITIRLLGGEAIIERAEKAEKDALRAAQEAKHAVEEAEKAIEALRQLSMHLSTTVLHLEAAQGLDMMRETAKAVRNRDVVRHHLEVMGCEPDQVKANLEPFNDLVAICFINEIAHSVNDVDPKIVVKKAFSLLSADQLLDAETVRSIFGQFVLVTLELDEVLQEVPVLQQTGNADFGKFRKFQGR